jgi:hypothetical protein
MRALKLIEEHVITLDDLWVQYWANGGNARELELEAFLNGAHELCPFDLNVIAWALEDLNLA